MDVLEFHHPGEHASWQRIQEKSVDQGSRICSRKDTINLSCELHPFKARNLRYRSICQCDIYEHECILVIPYTLRNQAGMEEIPRSRLRGIERVSSQHFSPTTFLISQLEVTNTNLSQRMRMQRSVVRNVSWYTP